MATPTGNNARAARGYYSRRRRRERQNFEAFGIAGTEAPPLRILEWFVDNGGSGYAVGDRVSLDAYPSPLPVIAEVTEETGGVVDAVKPVSGTSQTDPGIAFATTALTGSGLGLTLEPSTADIHNFGPTAPGGDSAFPLQIPADTYIAIEPSVALAIGDVAITNDFDTYPNAEAIPALGIVRIRQVFRKNQTLVVTRKASAPACDLKIYHRVNGIYVQFGECQFT